MLFPKVPDGVKDRLRDEVRAIYVADFSINLTTKGAVTKLSGYRYLISEQVLLFLVGDPDEITQEQFKELMNCRIFDAKYSGIGGVRSFLLIFDSESDCMMFELTHRANWNGYSATPKEIFS